MSNLYTHQRKALHRAMRQNLLIAHGCGTGKTRTAIHIAAIKGGPTLILAPVSVIEEVWLPEIEATVRSLRPCVLWGKPKTRRVKLLAERHRTYLCSIESARSIFKEIQRHGFKTLIVDESSKLKNYKTQATSLLLALAGVPTRGGKFKPDPRYVIPHRYALSGTPAPNDPIEYWPQIKFVAGLGKAFHDNFFRFRDQFFSAFNITPVTKLYRFRSNKADDFNRLLLPWSDVIKTEDVLPELKSFEQVRSIQLSKKELQAYKQMEDEFILEYGDCNVISSNALTHIGHLRQLISGFIYAETRSTGKVQIIGSSKLEGCKDLLEEIGDQRVIIWYNFDQERDSLLSIPGTIWAGKSKDRSANLKAFRSGEKRILVANAASLGHGVNLQFCHYAIYFSATPSYECYEQSRRRILRGGQKNKCFFYFLVAKGTYDEALMRIIRKKEKQSEATLNWLKERK